MKYYDDVGYQKNISYLIVINYKKTYGIINYPAA